MRDMKREPAAAVKRRYDPDRRANIALAAMRIVAAVGVDNLSFRAVAEAADVPVSRVVLCKTYPTLTGEELFYSVFLQPAEAAPTCSPPSRASRRATIFF